MSDVTCLISAHFGLFDKQMWLSGAIKNHRQAHLTACNHRRYDMSY
jgi:hypothetical protein